MKRPVAILLACLVLPVAARADTGAPAAGAAKSPAAEEVVEVEDVEVEVVDAAPGAAAGPRGGTADLLGRLHVAIVHLPIGWVLMSLLLELLALRRRELAPAGAWVLAGAVVSFVPGCVTGLLREGFVSPAPAVRALVQTHETLALTAAGLAIVALGLRLAFRKDLSGIRRTAYLAVLAASAATVAAAGHWGGKVAWGATNLPF
jgi:uncharacterized membrane protein